MAVSATLHCLAGCSIGEIAGLIIGTALALTNGVTFVLSIILAFICGYTLSSLPLFKARLSLKTIIITVLAADTVSILTMELVDNTVVALIPGAMNAGLVNPLFWLTMPLSLIVAFLAAMPVNKWLLVRGRGHALVHNYH